LRFERQVRAVSAPLRPNAATITAGKGAIPSKVLRFLPYAALVLGLAAIALTSVGREFAQSPSAGQILMIGIGGWALFTFARGFAKGEVKPFVQGFYSSYRRDAQPKRFWASMAWNFVFGCFCLTLALSFSLLEHLAGEPAIEQAETEGGRSFDEDLEIPPARDGGIRTLIRAEDYPEEAIDRNEQGTVQTKLAVGANGRVTDCIIVKSSGFDSLDRRTCEIMTERARFLPATDENGQPIASEFTPARVTWRLED
jgi:TonB family protein